MKAKGPGYCQAPSAIFIEIRVYPRESAANEVPIFFCLR